ncbi:MAG: helix-turn-helix domain-containing protein, partial [Gammaproteobacteria bacterium]
TVSITAGGCSHSVTVQMSRHWPTLLFSLACGHIDINLRPTPKQMLESGDQSMEAIANEVGYEDAGFFSRLFRRKVNLTPAQYRKRFGAMHRALVSAG